MRRQERLVGGHDRNLPRQRGQDRAPGRSIPPSTSTTTSGSEARAQGSVVRVKREVSTTRGRRTSRTRAVVIVKRIPEWTRAAAAATALPTWPRPRRNANLAMIACGGWAPSAPQHRSEQSSSHLAREFGPHGQSRHHSVRCRTRRDGAHFPGQREAEKLLQGRMVCRALISPGLSGRK